MINGTSYKKASQITVRDIYNGPSRMSVICSNQNQERECWHNFTLTQPMLVICLWADKRAGKNQTAVSFKFKLEITTTKQNPTPTKEGPLANSEKEITLTPQITRIGPYVIKRVGQQRLLFNSSWSLKRVELSMQINISAVKPACSPFISTSYTGWLAWLHGRSLTLPNRVKRDVTGILGTGLGVLNSIDAEVLADKLSTATHDLKKLEHPLQSSLSALGTHQWLLSDILPQWERVNEKDHQLIIDALGIAQNNISLALSCIQAQLWVQYTIAAIVREGEDGTLPTEIRKIIWEKATAFEREFQSWWYLGNFTHNPIDHKATAFVVTIQNASVKTIYPIIALGLNHNGTVLYPLEHRVWAQRNNNKWQAVEVDACMVREQQGFICESNTIKAEDFCLDTEHNVCHFEIHPKEIPGTVLIYIGKGCVCIRTLCNFIVVDNITVGINNHSNTCICNFTNIIGCDFNYSAPVTTYQLIQSNYTLVKDLLLTSIGMDLTRVKKFLQHNDLRQLLESAREEGQRTLITVHHDTEEIHRVLDRVKKDGEHRWWEAFLGWSPKTTGILNLMLHPVVILLLLTCLCLLLIIILYFKVWHMMKQIALMQSPRVCTLMTEGDKSLDLKTSL